MKKIFTFSAALIFAANLNAQVDFESITLNPESYDNGSAGAGDFTINYTTLSNYYDTAWYSWYGFSISNMTDDTTAGWANQYSAYTGGGYNGSSNYAVYYPEGTISVSDSGGVTGFYITNTTYAAVSMRDGDAYAKQFGSPLDANGNPDGTNGEDYFRVWIKGTDITGMYSDSLEFYLADYRFANDSLDYIVDTWEYIDLQSFSFLPQTVSFRFESSDVGAWGINTPTYFAVDDINITLPLGIEEQKIELAVFPNPVVNELFVNGSQGELTIRNASGQVVLFYEYNGHSALDVSQLSGGIYFVELVTDSGRIIKKVIK